MNKWSVLATGSSPEGSKMAAVSSVKTAKQERVQQKLYRKGGGGGGDFNVRISSFTSFQKAEFRLESEKFHSCPCPALHLEWNTGPFYYD